jgi:hypothetical protein
MTTTAKADYQIANEQAKALFDTLGLTCEMSQPVGDVRDDWPNILYQVTFHNPKTSQSFSTEYRLGVGHVKWTGPACLYGFTQTEENIFHALSVKPHATIKDQYHAAHAGAAAKVARRQKVAPKPFEVLAACCRDGLDAHGQSFEDYADNYGMDRDSRKGEATYRQCREIYFKVERLIGADNLRKLAELANQF